MKVEVTLQFEVPDDSDIDAVSPILRERIKDFDYKNELVQWTFITKPERSILYKDERLEQLERAISSFKELISNKLSIEATNLLSNHNLQVRESKD